ncbi:MAG: hypothetical protein AB8G05_04880 [Oligoflexales bacterium]
MFKLLTLILFLLQGVCIASQETDLECFICADNVEEIVKINCSDHGYCTDCWKSFFKEQIALEKYEIKCPDETCGLTLNLEEAEGLCDLEQIKVVRKKFERQLVQQQYKNKSLLCGKFLFGIFRYLSFGFLCPSEENACCIPSAEYEVCPMCKSIYQYTHGCPHMHCKKCNAQFVKDQQLTIPCWKFACGCYFPIYPPCCCDGFSCCNLWFLCLD